MKRLYLLRHAKSSWKEGNLPDRERRLAPRGRRATALLSTYIRSEQIVPELILCSPARRAQETFEGIASAFGEDPTIRTEDELYGSSAASLLQRLREIPEDVSSAMLIGHNPELQQLAVRLTPRTALIERIERKYPTGALATLTFDRRWADLDVGSASLAGLVTPDDLR
jgi:phosphohistidine phosphatase